VNKSDEHSVCPYPEANRGETALGRHKLWELDPGSHCSLVGTCLSLHDLRRLLRRADITVAPGTPDYDIHGYFVKESRCRSPLSKLIHKTLDRKYAPHIARFRSAACVDDLWALWRKATNEGDIAGAYWALMTHKTTPRAIGIRAHNEVHMLSHLMGRSSRKDTKRGRQLETRGTHRAPVENTGAHTNRFAGT
jgi:hypothetical protein